MYALVVALVVGYLALIELTKRRFFSAAPAAPGRTRQAGHRVHRRAARFGTSGIRDRADLL
jgi:hypothetical protein